MNKFLLMAAIFLNFATASAVPFTKEVQLNVGVVYFYADASNGEDQFGNNVVIFSKPTVNGLPISLQSADSDAVTLKTQLCEKLGYAFANGIGLAYETSYMGFFLDEEKQLTVKLFETAKRITHLDCLGSLR